MEHTIEPATSGRAGCRGCGLKIAKDELRLGERLPNPFADDSLMTHWFHLRCAAYKRPEVMLEVLEDPRIVQAGGLEDELRRGLADAARLGVEHRRLPRIDSVERAPTGRARCRSCRKLIDKGTWRIGLVFYQEGRFNPSGFVHLGCAVEYLGTGAILDRLRHFAPELSGSDVSDLKQLLAAASSG